MNQDAIFLLHQLAFKQRRLARHALFADWGPAALRRFAPALRFWVSATTDLLRITEGRVEDPALRAFASTRRRAEARRARQYRHDLDALGAAGVDDTATRDASYAIVGEAFRATSDVERIVLLLAVDAAGHVVFGAIGQASEPDLFHGGIRATLAHLELGDHAPEARGVVDRVFAAFETMCTGLAKPRASAPPCSVGVCS